jgi:hypothetical protein
MQNRYIFEYAIIRFVPKVEREEFFNVGVILFCKRKKFLDIKYQIDLDKFKAFAPEIELEVLNDYLNAWKLICDGDAAGGPIGKLEMSDRFRWLAACRSTIVQSSKTHPGICFEPEKELEDIFEKYIL